MVSIEKVITGRQRKEFAVFANKLYRDTAQYVPPLICETLQSMDPVRNPSLEFCETSYWLARRGGTVVGRIGVILNRKANEKWKTRRARFTAVDFIDDFEVSSALFAAAEKWAGDNGCDTLAGPLGFSDMDNEGMLVEGFEENGHFCTYYNFSYYPEHLKKLGYLKDAQWKEYRIQLPGSGKERSDIRHMASVACRMNNLHVLKDSTPHLFSRVAPDVFRLINICYAKLYSTTDFSEKQAKWYYKKFVSMVLPPLTAFVYNEKDELVAFAIGIPDISEAFRKNQGKLYPFGWLRLLRALRTSKVVDIMYIGVHPDYQGKGASVILLDKLLDGIRKGGYRELYTMPMLEDNLKVLSLLSGSNAQPYKCRCCFRKELT